MDLKLFEPSIRFAHGFWETTAIANCELALDVTVSDKNNHKLITTSVGSSRMAEGPGGSACSKGAEVLSDAISKTIRETMERYAERVSNSEKIRTAFKNP